MRVNVWLPDELVAAVREHLPDVNVSKTLQAALRSLLSCKHDRMVCAECAQPVDLAALLDEAKSAFYSQHQITAAKAPLPRPGRAQRQRQRDRAWLEAQEVS